MISFDTNLLLYSLNQDCPEHIAARDFFESLDSAPTVSCDLPRSRHPPVKTCLQTKCASQSERFRLWFLQNCPAWHLQPRFQIRQMCSSRANNFASRA